MQYRVISSDDVSEFEEEVEDALKDGWKLQGGVSCAKDKIFIELYAQAMIKEDDE